MERGEEIIKEICLKAKRDPNIIGVFLGGSRGKGDEFVTPNSDYDVYIIVKNNLLKYQKKFQSNEEFEFMITSLSEFRKDSEEWERYTYTHVIPLVDKERVIQKILAEKSRLPKSILKEYISGYLDGYINGVYRSLKSWRDGNRLAAKLEANRSLEFFFKVIFALDSGRVAPYYKYLQWEIEKFPIKGFPLASQKLLKETDEITSTGSISAQQKILVTLEGFARRKGYSLVLNGWGKKLSWMKEFRL